MDKWCTSGVIQKSLHLEAVIALCVVPILVTCVSSQSKLSVFGIILGSFTLMDYKINREVASISVSGVTDSVVRTAMKRILPFRTLKSINK